MKAIGSNVTGAQGDVAQLADLDRLYETVSQVKGRIDVVFANAGVAEFAPLGCITEQHFDKLFNINVRGKLFTVQKALLLLNDGGFLIPHESGIQHAKLVRMEVGESGWPLLEGA